MQQNTVKNVSQFRMSENFAKNVTIKGMWYLRKVASSWKQFGPVSTCLCLKYIKILFLKFRK